MTAMEDAAGALAAAGLLVTLGYLLRYQEWTFLVSGFVSGLPGHGDERLAAHRAGKGMLMAAIPLAIYGVATLVGVAQEHVFFVTFLAVLFIGYRIVHWVTRSGHEYGMDL